MEELTRTELDSYLGGESVFGMITAKMVRVMTNDQEQVSALVFIGELRDLNLNVRPATLAVDLDDEIVIELRQWLCP